jgi:recombination associated protein RdgC
MWFKNLFFYRFTKPFEITHQDLESRLAETAFRPCNANEMITIGWTSPLKNSEQLLHITDRYWMLCLQKQERILPGSVINEQVESRLEEIESQQHRKVSRKERTEIKEAVTIELMPKAFTRTTRLYGYLCPDQGYLIINTSSGKQADDFTSFLRKTIGSLPIRLPQVQQAPATIMNQWLLDQHSIPTNFTLGCECELTATGDDKGSVKYRGIELEKDQIEQHIEAGMEVASIALNWRESVQFVLSTDLCVKRIKFGDLLREKLDDTNAETAAEQFDAGFAIMALEFDRLVPELFEVFGGEDQSAIVEESLH